MSAIDELIHEYNQLRASGMAVKDVLNTLRTKIETLDEKSKQALARHLHGLEAQKKATNTTRRVVVTPDKMTQTPTQELTWVNCPHCGKSNQKHELLCYSCGRLLERSHSEFETQALAETNDLTFSNDYFGHDSFLVLKVRGSEEAFEAQPQKTEQELIIGRKVEGSAVFPDIDLSDVDGEIYGVSRLHMSVRYQPKYNTLSVFDLGSANGSYINGQRLHPHEVRVLRHNDEIRLGKLVMKVAYRHS